MGEDEWDDAHRDVAPESSDRGAADDDVAPEFSDVMVADDGPVPLAGAEPAAALGRGRGPGGDGRRPAGVAGDASEWRARPRRPIRCRGVPGVEDPRRTERLRALPSGGGPAQAIAIGAEDCRSPDQPAGALVEGAPGDPPLDGGEPRGPGP